MYKKSNKFPTKILELPKHKISLKILFIFSILMSISIIIFSTLSYRMSSSIIKDDFIQYKQQINSELINNIDKDLSSLTRESLFLYNNSSDIIPVLDANISSTLDTDYLHHYKKVDDYLQSILQSNLKLSAITIIDINGKIIYHINRHASYINLKTVKETPWFEETLSLNGFPLIREPHFNEFLTNSSSDNTPVISVSRSIMDISKIDNPTKGVILLDQNISQIDKVVQNPKINPKETIILIGNSGNIIYSNKTLSDDASNKISSFANYKDSSYQKLEIDGQNVIATYVKSNEFGWKMISLLPYSELEKKSSFIKKINFQLIITINIIVIIISILLSNFIVSPLKKLMVSFKELETGNFDIRVPITSKDELGQISQSFNTMAENMNILIKQKYELGILHEQAKFGELQSRINPHYLYNTLASIKEVVQQNDTHRASIMLQSLSDSFRYNLNNDTPVVTLKEELEYVKKYIFLQKCRFDDKFDVEYDIEEKTLSCHILRLTLQPLIENALYHGIQPKFDKCKIIITAKIFDNLMYIYIADTGIGIPQEKLIQLQKMLTYNSKLTFKSTSTKIGISNVNARIKLYYGENFGLNIQSSNEGTIVKIVLPNISL